MIQSKTSQFSGFIVEIEVGGQVTVTICGQLPALLHLHHCTAPPQPIKPLPCPILVRRVSGGYGKVNITSTQTL